jgi:homoserine O-acetyltransferase
MQPRSAHFATVFYLIATSGGTLRLQKLAPTRSAADEVLDGRLAAPFAVDANDLLYQDEASRDYDPSPEKDRGQCAHNQFCRRRTQSPRNRNHGKTA